MIPLLLPRRCRILSWLLTGILITAFAATRSYAYWDCYDVAVIVHHEAVTETVYHESSGHSEWAAEEIAVWQEDPEAWSTMVIYYEVWVEDSPGYWESVVVQPAYDEVAYETHCDWVPDTE